MYDEVYEPYDKGSEKSTDRWGVRHLENRKVTSKELL